MKSGKNKCVAGVNFCDEGFPVTNNDYKQGGTMKIEFEDNKFVTYLMLGMMALGFVVMLLV
jgi:hypothetical protein